MECFWSCGPHQPATHHISNTLHKPTLCYWGFTSMSSWSPHCDILQCPRMHPIPHSHWLLQTTPFLRIWGRCIHFSRSHTSCFASCSQTYTVSQQSAFLSCQDFISLHDLQPNNSSLRRLTHRAVIAGTREMVVNIIAIMPRRSSITASVRQLPDRAMAAGALGVGMAADFIAIMQRWSCITAFMRTAVKQIMIA